MTNKRKKYDSSFKAKVAIEAIRERETLNELAAKYELSPVMISRWKKEFICYFWEPEAWWFSNRKAEGSLSSQNRWFRDAIGDRDTRRRLISPNNKVSIHQQCRILGLSRTAHCYKPKGESSENLEIMQRIDKRVLN